MEVAVSILTWLSEIVRWVVGKMWSLFVRWWLGWIRRRMSEAIIPSDFSVNIVTGVDPLRLKLRFRLHNGSASSIRLNGIKAHLFCGGAHVGSVAGAALDNPFVYVSPANPTIGRGKSVDISIDITPDIYLWFWLLPDSGYSLHSSIIEVLTSWGAIDVPLTGKVVSEVRQYKGQIDEFRDRVRRVFGISQ